LYLNDISTCYTVISVEDALEHAWLGRLTRQVSGAVHRRGLVLTVGNAMARDLGASAVELTLPSADRDDGHVVLAWQAAADSVIERPANVPIGRSSELSVRRVQRQWEVRVPVPLSTTQHGELAILFEGQGRIPPITAHSDRLLAVGCIVGLACHGCDLVAKVAAVSRRAHQQKRQLQRRLSELEVGGGERPIVAASRAMREVLEQIELVAPHATAVLIRGESGTGKELLARHVHQRSDRASGSFIAVNCAALPEALIESELFGHEQGAFTGAHARHIGRFERANGGTLFLDEVGELPASVQGKLLRALQERVIERVGGREPIEIDVRVVAATHRDLEDMLSDGRFRTDLFYRLNVFPVHVPPLRERPDDIAELARTKLRSMCVKLGRDVPELSQRQLNALCSVPWPGNIRELENYLERALILSTGRELLLPEQIERKPASAKAARRTLHDAMKVAIIDALERSGGKLYGAAGAAAALGMKPTTLQSKMRKLGIQRAAYAR
jgi:transcriptional regulator with GAF, ATPase, and Fis domain